MQNDTTTNKTHNTKSSDKKSLKINLAFFESKSVTNNIFGMNSSVKTNYHIAFNKIVRIFDANAIHCNEVKHSTSDDYEKLKD